MANSRILALDGVRGIAAFIVLLHHASLVARGPLQSSNPELWTALETGPAKLLLLGTEAVLVFFVLSGLVVALPAFRAGFSWTGYAASRLARLYLPVWATLVFAALLVVLLPRDTSVVSDSWLTERSATEFEWDSFLHQLTLSGATYPLSNPLWSLRWELLFSVLLPAFVAIALLLRRHIVLATLLTVALSILGRVIDESWMIYLPAFLVGTLIAVRLDDVQRWGEAVRARRPWLLPVLAVASIVLLAAHWWYRAPWFQDLLPWRSSDGNHILEQILFGAALLGALGVIVLAITWPGTARLLESRLAQWLGKVSFSLYLVHVPILATWAFLLGDANWPWAVAAGLVTSLAAGWAMWRFVERPSHRFARWIGGKARAAESAVTGTAR